MRLIDADAWKKDLHRRLGARYRSTAGGQFDDGGCDYLASVASELDERPTVDAEPVVHAHWEKQKTSPYLKCSYCEYVPYIGTNYCPHCGAKMDEVKSE